MPNYQESEVIVSAMPGESTSYLIDDILPEGGLLTIGSKNTFDNTMVAIKIANLVATTALTWDDIKDNLKIRNDGADLQITTPSAEKVLYVTGHATPKNLNPYLTGIQFIPGDINYQALIKQIRTDKLPQDLYKRARDFEAKLVVIDSFGTLVEAKRYDCFDEEIRNLLFNNIAVVVTYNPDLRHDEFLKSPIQEFVTTHLYAEPDRVYANFLGSQENYI